MDSWTPSAAMQVGDTLVYHPRGPRGGNRKPVVLEVVETFPHQPILSPEDRIALTSMAAIFTQLGRRRMNKEARKKQHAHQLVGIMEGDDNGA